MPHALLSAVSVSVEVSLLLLLSLEPQSWVQVEDTVFPPELILPQHTQEAVTQADPPESCLVSLEVLVSALIPHAAAPRVPRQSGRVQEQGSIRLRHLSLLGKALSVSDAYFLETAQKDSLLEGSQT